MLCPFAKQSFGIEATQVKPVLFDADVSNLEVWKGLIS